MERILTQSLDKIAKQLAETPENNGMCHIRRRGEPLPSQEKVKEIVSLCRALIFPGFFGDSGVTQQNMRYHAGLNLERLSMLLIDQIVAGKCIESPCCQPLDVDSLTKDAIPLCDTFIRQLPELRRVLMTDVDATYKADPAALSIEEVIYCYPSILATSAYRVAHLLHTLDVPVIPRMITELAHSETGIDIHPAATIGESFTIDHGTGIVIGDTCIIGDNVKIFQGVTLGAKSFKLDENNNPIKGIPRHPIIGNNVVIYANATILGRIQIGDGAIIGGNLWVTEDVAPGEKIVQAPAKENR